jgi:hypothetical protein
MNPGDLPSMRRPYRISCDECFDEADAAGVAAFFFHLVEASEIEARTARGFVASHASSDVFGDLLFEVERISPSSSPSTDLRRIKRIRIKRSLSIGISTKTPELQGHAHHSVLHSCRSATIGSTRVARLADA